MTLAGAYDPQDTHPTDSVSVNEEQRDLYPNHTWMMDNWKKNLPFQPDKVTRGKDCSHFFTKHCGLCDGRERGEPMNTPTEADANRQRPPIEQPLKHCRGCAAVQPTKAGLWCKAGYMLCENAAKQCEKYGYVHQPTTTIPTAEYERLCRVESAAINHVNTCTDESFRELIKSVAALEGKEA